jgi:hypothetical protein
VGPSSQVPSRRHCLMLSLKAPPVTSSGNLQQSGDDFAETELEHPARRQCLAHELLQPDSLSDSPRQVAPLLTAAMADSPLASNNPFRRKGATQQLSTPDAAFAEPESLSKDETPSPAPTGREFRDQLRALPRSAAATPSTSFQKIKPIKKVRVQSPPPSSPESIDADFEARFPAAGPPDRNDASESEDEDTQDPFQNEDASLEPEVPSRATTTFPQRPPPNPFQKTLSDAERQSNDGVQGATGGGMPARTGSLDVGSFGRLLMTGQASTTAAVPTINAPPQSGLPAAHGTGDAGSITDASSVSRHSIFDAAHVQETPRTSHEISDTEDEHSGLIQTPQPPSQRTTLRKKPPPPSSRHGKLIKIQLKNNDGEQAVEDTPAQGTPENAAASKSGRPSSSSSDLNKPLPPPPSRSMDEDPESVFDREAAGKIPEVDVDPDAPDEDIPPPRPPTPPNASHSTSTPSKKPAPPPRRQAHARNESKATSVLSAAGTVPPKDTASEDAELAAPRSSLDSGRSVPSVTKAGSNNIPAPPPPRRPTHISRPSNSFASPSAQSFSTASSPSAVSEADRSPAWPVNPSSLAGAVSPSRENSGLGYIGASAAAQSKLSPPPPPPARNTSVRSKDQRTSEGTGRPPSVSSMDAPSRRISRENMMAPPPPPPPRQRGSSRGSMDGAGPPGLGPRKASVDSVRLASSGSMGAMNTEAGITVVTEEPAETEAELLQRQRGESAADEILADLTALQREVDALRGQFGKE